MPWGWSPAVAEQLGVPWNPDWRQLFDKTWAIQQRRSFADQCPSDVLLVADEAVYTELDPVLEHLQRPGSWVVKTPFSTAGFGRTRVEGRPDKSRMGWIKKQLEAGPVIVERWVDRLLDFSVQVTIGDRVQVSGITLIACCSTAGPSSMVT